MTQVVILSLRDRGRDGACGGESCDCALTDAPRVPVLACAEALRSAGAGVELVTACDEAEVDTALKPLEAGDARLILAADSDAAVRFVVRRLVRRYAPPPSKRPTDLPEHRTVFDLPAIGLLALTPAIPGLVTALGLPTEPAAVAAATLAGTVRRLDLLRTDSGSVTLHGALLGGLTDAGEPAGFQGVVAVDDVVLTNPDETVLACAIQNVGSADLDGLPLVPAATSGSIEVAVAVPVLRRRLVRSARVQVEVRRARGRAMSVTPHQDEIRFVDDGVAGPLTRKRSWWVEPGAWAVHAPAASI